MNCQRANSAAETFRPGFTLVELSAVTIISAVLMGVAVSVLLLMEKQDTHIGLKFQQTQDIARLADRFRTDVHQAKSVRSGKEDEAKSLLAVCISPSGNRVEYHAHDNRIIRQETTSTGELRPDRFMLPTQATAALSFLDSKVSPNETTTGESKGELAQLSLSWPLANDVGAKPRLEVVAEIGKGLPFQLETGGGDRETLE